jgi:hypothetical protein
MGKLVKKNHKRGDMGKKRGDMAKSYFSICGDMGK